MSNITLSDSVRNAMLDAIQTSIGDSAVVHIRTGAAPTHVSDPSTGAVLATLQLPSSWMAAASGGVKAKSGTWQDVSADASGVAAHFEICAADGTTVHMRGTVVDQFSSGDMTIDNVNIEINQTFTINTFTITAPGA